MLRGGNWLYTSLSYQTTCKVSSGFSFLKVHSSVLVADRSRKHQPLGWFSSSGENKPSNLSSHPQDGQILKPADPLFRLSICPQKYIAYAANSTTGQQDMILSRTKLRCSFIFFTACTNFKPLCTNDDRIGLLRG